MTRILKVYFEVDSEVSEVQFKEILEKALNFSSDPNVTSVTPNAGLVYQIWHKGEVESAWLDDK